MFFIRQGATHKVVIGPAVAVGDGFTPVTNLALSTADEAEVILHDNGTIVDISGYTFAAITTADGYYHLTLQSGISNTVGHMTVVINDDSLILPLRADFTVLEEAVYDAMYASGATGLLPANVTQISGDSVAADNAESFFDGTGYAGTNNVIPSVTTVTGNVDGSVASVTGAVGSVTGNVGGSVASVTGAVGSVTGNVGGNVTGSVGSVTGHTPQTGDTFALANGAAGFVAIDTVVDAILADTGTDGVVLSTATQQSIATELLDLANGVETSETLREFLRLARAVLLGKASGLSGTSAVFRDRADSKDRVTATVDEFGNRTAVTTDAT